MMMVGEIVAELRPSRLGQEALGVRLADRLHQYVAGKIADQKIPETREAISTTRLAGVSKGRA